MKVFFLKKNNESQSHLLKTCLQPQNWGSTDLHKLIISQQTLLITSQQQRIRVLNKILGKFSSGSSRKLWPDSNSNRAKLAYI